MKDVFWFALFISALFAGAGALLAFMMIRFFGIEGFPIGYGCAVGGTVLIWIPPLSWLFSKVNIGALLEWFGQVISGWFDYWRFM
ncbi:MAG: hypothetical protein KIS92_00815 [Planctomycetota bacterium]|nr:hypothetical protein [Planctomycetota bacterium]